MADQPLNPDDDPANPDDPIAGGRGGVASRSVAPSGDSGINGLLSGSAWASSTISYSFPTSASAYGSSDGTGTGQYPEVYPFESFGTVTPGQQAEIQRAFSLISSYTNLTFDWVLPTSAATLRFANSSPAVVPTAYAFFPSIGITGGDVWFGGTGQDPLMGNFSSANAVLHEIGHALGLKHGQDVATDSNGVNFGKIPAPLLSNEYSVMNYPAYVGDTSTTGSPIGPGSSPQTYMMYDISALQYMYGANFGDVGIRQTYSWDPATGQEFINGVGQGVPVGGADGKRIFSTVWTGGATATYDLSNFSQDATLDLNPGGVLRFSDSQLADLGAGNRAGVHIALSNVYNALLYDNDTRSEVSGLITGNGNDIVFGNGVFDVITLGNGNDTVTGGSGGGYFIAGAGSDVFTGGAGTNIFNLGTLQASEKVTGAGNNNTVIFSDIQTAYTSSFNNGTLTITSIANASGVASLTGVQTLQFGGAIVAASSLECFAAGTLIATPDGPVAVERLSVGRLVLSARGEACPVVWLGHRAVNCIVHPNPETVWPVRIAAHAFGAGAPMRELLLSPDHGVFVDGVLIPVKYLINGSSIRQVRVATVAYYHVGLPRHEVIRAEGLSVESYLDVGSRENFANGGGVGRLHPDFAMRVWEAAGCAPLMVSGPQLAAVRRLVREQRRVAAAA